MRATVFFKTLLISLGIVGVSVGNAHAQSSTVSTATQIDDGITYGDFFLDSPRANQSADWGVWTLSGLGVASLGIGTALYIVGRSDQSSLEDLERDDEGRIRNITQRNAARMEADVQSRLEAGKGYIIGGITLGALAVAWYYLGRTEHQSTEATNNVAPFGWTPQWDLRVQSGSLEVLGEVSF